jgi:peptidoglycan/LPS O-acetylase OafA/YrhL
MPAPPTSLSRFALIDAFKAVASQLIVLHHLAFYGPMSDVVYPAAPALISWLSQHGRVAVAVFLVVGGFLAARSLAPRGTLLPAQPLQLLRRRYLKLVLPYAVALLLAIVCAAVARSLIVHDSIPEAANPWQVLAHLLLLHDLLQIDALSAGVWYVAIDFQAFVLLLGLLWLGRQGRGRMAGLGLVLVAILGVAGLFYFNRHPDFDHLALYFFGSYALGCFAWWASGSARARGWLLLMAAVAALALLVDFRERLALALLVALALGIGRRTGALQTWPHSRVLAYLGQISYAVFLLNFPVSLLVNALFTRYAPAQPGWQAGGMLLAWLLCNAAGALFYRWVELPASRWRG